MLEQPSLSKVERVRWVDSGSSDGILLKAHVTTSWAVLLLGLALWTVVQGLLVSIPIWTRALPPEVDDSLAYLVRTREMQECFFQDCPALLDLKRQREIGLTDPQVRRAHDLSAFPFPIYHPLFSLLILGMQTVTGDLITAYKVLWSLSPLFFASAFACLLTVLWGRSAAGITLGILAFKIFPDTGLHYLTPANLAMGMATLMWSRIIVKRGDAPWTLIFGTLLLVVTHPIGAVYAMMSFAFSAMILWEGRKLKAWLSIAGASMAVLLSVALMSFIKQPSVINMHALLSFFPHPTDMASACAYNLEGIAAGISRLKESLLGNLESFALATTAGFILIDGAQRRILFRLILIFAPILLVSLLPTHANNPSGDLFFRLWIPLAVIIHGATGKALSRLGHETLMVAREISQTELASVRVILNKAWPALFFALLVGYSVGTAFTGGEHVYALGKYMQDRQRLSFDSKQVVALLSEAAPGDRVLYNAIMPMEFYFTRGAMQLGATYFHPSYSGTPIETDWLTMPELRFAVAYNPAVFHPMLDGLEEKDRSISSPEFRFSPLSRPRRHNPILQEGFIPLGEFKWINLEMEASRIPGRLRIFVCNPEGERTLEFVPQEADGGVQTQRTIRLVVPAHWEGWIESDLAGAFPEGAFQLKLPNGPNRLSLGGINFSNSALRWPWESKSKLTLFAKDPSAMQVTLDFDPRTLLPPIVRSRRIEVMDDGGSSVLLRLGP